MVTRLQHLSHEQTEELGRFCATLLTDDNSWVYRRKESVTVLDEATIRRQQSVDFTMSMIESLEGFKCVCDQVFGDEICVAPLFILDKDPASTLAFDLNDETGRSLSLMTTAENGEISAATLKVICEKKLREHNMTLSDELAEVLDQLATADTTDGRLWLSRLEDPMPKDEWGKEAKCLLDAEQDGGQMRWWLTTLAFASIVMVTFGAGSNHRRVIKIAYEQPITNGPSLLSLLGWRSFKTLLFTPLIMSQRYHFDVKAPPDFRLTQVALVNSKARRALKAPGFRRRAQLYIDDVHDPRGAIARFALRVSGRGVLGGALVASLLVLAAILACIHFKKGIAEDSGSGPALLLVLPGIIATYVARADQHGLTTRLLAIPRWILLLFSGVAAYYAAGAIALIGHVEQGLKGHRYQVALNTHAEQIQHWLTYPAVSAAVAVVIIGIGWICTRETTHWLGRWLNRTWHRYTRTRFRIEVNLRVPAEAVWEHVHAETGKLLETDGLLMTRATNAHFRKAMVHRAAGPVNWTHGIEVVTAPIGATVHWVFWANGPLALKPLLFLLVGWERAMAAYRITAFKRSALQRG